jgi:hypothetical protein
MNRDMDLVRELLLKIATATEPPNFSAIVPDRNGGTPEYAFAAYHMKMLIDEVGLVRGIDVCAGDKDEWLELYLTWKGQDFLDTIRDPTAWRLTKESVKKVGGASWEIVIDIAKAVLKEEAKKRLGLDL